MHRDALAAREAKVLSNDTSESIRFLRRLRTVRDFTTDPVPDEALADILEVGRWTGSANNRQPTEVIVVSDPEVRQKLVSFGANTAGKAPVVLVIVTPGDPARFELEVFDEGLLAERIQLAALAHGLGTGITTLKGEGPAGAKELLGVPSEKRVRCVIALGMPDRAAIQAKPKNPQPRKPTSDFAHWGRY
jgi:nitroreductase